MTTKETKETMWSLASGKRPADRQFGRGDALSKWGRFEELFKANWRYGIDPASEGPWRRWVETCDASKLEEVVSREAAKGDRPPGLGQLQKAYRMATYGGELDKGKLDCRQCEGTGVRWVLMSQGEVEGWIPCRRNGVTVWLCPSRGAAGGGGGSYVDPLPCLCAGGAESLQVLSFPSPLDWQAVESRQLRGKGASA